MSKNGWEFIEPARRHSAKFVRACIRIDDVFSEIPVAELQFWLERMTFFDDHSDPEWQQNLDPTSRGRVFDFAIWDDTGAVWFPGPYDGVAVLKSLPATPEAWLQEQKR